MSLIAPATSNLRLVGCKARCFTPSRGAPRRPSRITPAQAQGETERTPDGKQVKKVSDPMSPEFKQRLREEYTGLGGSPNKPMSQNYFLIISLVVAFLAILTKLTGNI